MKKSILVLMCLAALLLGGCAGKGNLPLGHGLVLIETIGEMIDCEEYFKNYINGSSQYDEKVEELRGYDISKPKYVYRVTYDNIELLNSVLGENVSDDTSSFYAGKAGAALISKLNSNEGIECIVMSSCFSLAKTFECTAVKEDMVYFYIYEDVIMSVVFTDGEGNSCTASATVVLSTFLDTSSVSSFEESLEKTFSGCDFDVEKVY